MIHFQPVKIRRKFGRKDKISLAFTRISPYGILHNAHSVFFVGDRVSATLGAVAITFAIAEYWSLDPDAFYWSV